MAEWRLRSSADSSDIVLCFGNLPPLFGCRARVFVYLQNRYLLGSSSKHLGLWGRARIFVERLWIRCRLGNAELVVQTDSMAREVRKFLGRDSHVIPFAPICRREHPEGSPKYDFVYVASGEPHKNHRNLVAAWIELATSDLRPSLALTLDRARHPQLVNWIESMSRKHGLLIDNLGHLSGESVAQLYARSRALVYPSRFESFGLPLVEANHAGLEILAPEADYVRDVVEPVETFDPESPVSICRAVRRYLGRPQAPQRVLSPGEFVARILGPNFRP
jgi:glycosyltransferase involved in cell wall biosynthesis